MLESIKQITDILPGKNILINTAIVSTDWKNLHPQIEDAKLLIENALQQFGSDVHFQLGLDYYNDIPESPLLPWFTGKDRIDNISFLELTSKDGSRVFKNLENWGKTKDVEIVATEIQLRPGANRTISIDQAEYTFARIIKALLPNNIVQNGSRIPVLPPDKKLSIGVWGVELLAK